MDFPKLAQMVLMGFMNAISLTHIKALTYTSRRRDHLKPALLQALCLTIWFLVFGVHFGLIIFTARRAQAGQLHVLKTYTIQT